MNGTVYTGRAHFAAMCSAYIDMTPDQVRQVAERAEQMAWEEGFLTDQNRFVSRDEAAAIAKQSKQAMTRYTPEMNDGAHVFVFGSNLEGRHGRGAALDAVDHWSARRGVGRGRTGDAYAIPTKGYDMQVLPLAEIKGYVQEFIDYARTKPRLTFLITPVGCGLAGYTHEDMAPLFKGVPDNCVLPQEWLGLA